MLETLQIENVALIERAEITFGAGLNVLTGETGAGKSIIVDALSAAAGGRAARELVRSGESAASVTAEFSGVTGDGREGNVTGWLAANGIEPEEGGGLIISRRLTIDGKNTCRVNGAIVSVAQLRELGMLLIDIHGQNDGRRLLDEKTHLASLDAFGGHHDTLAEYTKAYSALRETQRALRAIIDDESERERRADTLRRQIEELEAAKITPGEAAELTERAAILGNALKISEAFEGAYTALYGREDTYGATALLRDAERSLEGAAGYSKAFDELASRARDARYAAEDIAEELRDALNKLDFYPGELDEVNERLALIARVTRKYGGGEREAAEFLDGIKKELEDIEFSDERRLKLESEREVRLAAARNAAEKLTKARRRAADKIRIRMAEELSQLAMPGVSFEVELVRGGEENELTASGAEDARFLMSANAGEAPGRISRIASGGELSRIMLSLKNVLSESDGVDVSVFDEIDAGVSGVAAQRVGEKLHELARIRQVLCVTHLPQIAAMADTHFEITKSERNGRTATHIEPLEEEGRALEISRLTGGDNITENTKKAAREQLAAAQAFKKKHSAARRA
ncbi:MAG: DNA repair protein RecN [Oscillospiraceae bacterium]|jgi:DNA repair protein RecN (Recombination protein N)|nr:DNA repair protein RecN [Oscillospiraceae bacterium]